MRGKMKPQESLLFVLFPASQWVPFLYWFHALLKSDGDRPCILFLAVFLLNVLTDFIVYRLMCRVTKLNEEEAKNRFLTHTLAEEPACSADLSEQENKIQIMQRDVISHIRQMRELLNENKNQEAAACALQIEERAQGKPAYCEHPVVDAYLHTAVQIAARNKHVLLVEVSVPADIPVQSVELISTFGNLLDNAREACEGMVGAVIRLYAAVYAGYFMVSTENPVFEKKSSPEKRRRIPELERGIGTGILRELADKYEGAFRTYIKDEVFYAEATYRITEK